MNRQNRKKGFTLIELIVVMALIGIVGSGLASMLVPSTNLAASLSVDVQAKTKAEQLIRIALHQIEFSGELEFFSETARIGENAQKRYLYTEGGRLYLFENGDARDLLGEAYYNGYHAGLAAVKTEKNLMSLECTVTFPGYPDVRHTLTTSMRSLNTPEILGDGGTVMAYTWSSP